MNLRIAVAGVGNFGSRHLRVLATTGGVQIAGVYDVHRETAEKVAAEYGCPVFSSLSDLAAAADGAIVAVPTTAHTEVGCRLLEAGLDILVEKPIAPNLAEAQQLIDAAERHGRILQVGHLERFNPAILALSRVVTTPLFFEIHRLSLFSPRSLDVDVVLDLMIHDLDILLSLVGKMPQEIRAAGLSILSSNVDIANVRLAFPGGCVANLTASRVSTERVRKLRLFQPYQYLSVDYQRQDLASFRVQDDQTIAYEPVDVKQAEPLRLEIEAFLDSMATRHLPRVDGREAARALQVALEIADTMQRHAEVVAETLRESGIETGGAGQPLA